MSQFQAPILNVIKNGYCIGCGACTAVSNDIRIIEDKYGKLIASFDVSKSSNVTDNKLNLVCPFSSVRNEDDIARDLFSNVANYDEQIGYHESIYCGGVASKADREVSSSGGIVSYVLKKLLHEGDIDGVIHVSANNEVGNLFGYTLSFNDDDIAKGAKSRYYPVSFEKVINEVRGSNKRFAFVGVPCFVKAIRLLCENDAEMSDRIQYTIAIFCGHMKSKNFAEMIGWQLGVEPSNLSEIDFRLKKDTKAADHYKVSASSQENSIVKSHLSRRLYGMDWGLGYFKPKACDWCDDIAGETADISCGDAWLPDYVNNPLGTNIVIVRNRRIDQLLKKGLSDGELVLNNSSKEEVVRSQAANYRHRREGLSVRLTNADSNSIWHPLKRVKKDSFSITEDRKKIYEIREQIAEVSLINFNTAKKYNSFILFYILMFKYDYIYSRYNKNFLKKVIKDVYALSFYFLNKFR